jgi:hypothetical protein
MVVFAIDELCRMMPIGSHKIILIVPHVSMVKVRLHSSQHNN